MSRAEQEFPTQVYDSIQAAFTAAAEAAAQTNGIPVAGIVYRQGGRRFIATSLTGDLLTSLVGQTKSVSAKQKQTYDVDSRRNRPLDAGHKNTIKQYLLEVEDYILPPVLLNSREPLRIFTVKSSAAAVSCVFVLPRGEHLFVTDGQHRVEALRDAIREQPGRPQLLQDAVAVSIVEEEDIDKTHQDFYDAAQVKALPPALLVEYDQREPINRLTKDLVRDVPIFKGRIQRLGSSVSKNSPFMFTNNMIKRAVVAMLAGDEKKETPAGHIATPAQELWRNRLSHFFSMFTEANPQWQEVSQRTLESGQQTDVPGLREKYLHFTGAGLLIIGGVGHSILAKSPANSEELTAEQVTVVQALAGIDWHREAPVWKRSIIGGDGTIQPHRGVVAVAVADVKQMLGLELTEREEGMLKRIANGNGQHS
jgi:DNA sulfur modification protein DndB